VIHDAERKRLALAIKQALQIVPSRLRKKCLLLEDRGCA